MVGARGFEPPTPWSRTRCATRLRYAPNVLRWVSVEVRVLLLKRLGGACCLAYRLVDFSRHSGGRGDGWRDTAVFWFVALFIGRGGGSMYRAFCALFFCAAYLGLRPRLICDGPWALRRVASGVGLCERDGPPRVRTVSRMIRWCADTFSTGLQPVGMVLGRDLGLCPRLG